MLALKTFLVLVACAAVHGFQSVPSLSGASSLPRALRPSFAGSLAKETSPFIIAGSNVDGRRQRILLLRGTSAATMQLGEKNTGGTSVLERPTVTTANPSNEEVVDPKKPYHVLLFNDPMNTREYVCEVLKAVFGHSKSQSYSIMQTAHSTGFAVCNTTDKKEADAQSAELGNANLMSSVVEAN